MRIDFEKGVRYSTGFSGNRPYLIFDGEYVALFLERNPDNQEISRVVVEANIQTKKFTLYQLQNETTEEMKGISESSIGSTRFSDFLTWEGELIDGRPCGWGNLYDESKNLTYNGFVYQNCNLYGHVYDSASGKLVYSGCLLNGVYYGKGVAMSGGSDTGSMVEWIHGESTFPRNIETPPGTLNEESIHSLVVELTIGHDSFYNSSITDVHFLYFSKLTELTIQNNCFLYATECIIAHCPLLQVVHIADNCFSSDGIQGTSRFFAIHHCSSLSRISFGKRSFPSFNHFSLSNLSNLRSCKFQRGSFMGVLNQSNTLSLSSIDSFRLVNRSSSSRSV